jgi:hypothetical protein
VGPRAVPVVKQAVREVHHGQAAATAARALDADGPAAVRALLSNADAGEGLRPNALRPRHAVPAVP